MLEDPQSSNGRARVSKDEDGSTPSCFETAASLPPQHEGRRGVRDRVKTQPAAVGNDRWLRSIASGLLFTMNVATRACEPSARGRASRQDLFLRSRISANTFHAGLPASPTDFATSGTSARRNGLAAFSAPMIDGIVGSLAARSFSTSVARARSAALAGWAAFAEGRVVLGCFCAPKMR